MNALFVEASAKTAVGVQDAFRDVVERILDTPELWQTGAARGKGARSGTGAAGATGSRDADMPGGIDLSKDADDAESGGCSC